MRIAAAVHKAVAGNIAGESADLLHVVFARRDLLGNRLCVCLYVVPEEIPYRSAVPDDIDRLADRDPGAYLSAPVCADILVWNAIVCGDAVGGVVGFYVLPLVVK